MKILLSVCILSFLVVSMLKSQTPFIIYDNSTKKSITIDEMVKSTIDADVIFFGEFHDDSLNHYLQEDFLKKFYDKKPKTIVSLEMFERDVQKFVDSYLSDEITEEDFLKSSRPWPDYQKFYKPLVELAKQNKSKVIAANIPRKYAAMYVNGGMTSYNSLTDEEKSFIAKTMVLKEDEYLSKFLETMTGSKEPTKDLNHNKLNTLYLYYGAQCIKDETMSESILDALNKNPGSKIIHFNGDFHSNSYLGTAAMLKRRKSDLKIAVITPNYYEKIEETNYNDELTKQGNIVIYLPQPKKEPMPQMMGGASHFGENFVAEHQIDLKIIPESSSIIGEDKIKFKNPILKSTSLKLLKSVEVKNISDKDGNISFTINPKDDYYNEIVLENKSLESQSYSNGGIKETFEITVTYEGQVNYSPSEINLTTRHSNTPGIISPKDNEGIYLPGGAYYPQADKDLATFQARIRIPSGYKLIISGEVIAAETDQGTTYRISSKQLLDELIIVGGKYQSLTEVHDSVQFSVYYYKESPNHKKYIEESIKYYDAYTKLFGKYPYKSFSIVENFFPTGFGMPGYTLLSDKLMAMPWVTLSPGSLAHEFVHNWWGNSVFVDYNLGNWCEALTTFSTNYYYNVISGNKKEEIDFRRKALIAIDALESHKNYPVNDFKYQKNTFDAVIGYSKGAMILNEMLKLMGKERFFGALKSFAEKFSGKRAYWMNITSEFVEKTKDTLNDIKIRNVMNDWLKTKDIPEIKFLDKPVFDNENITVKISSSIKRIYSLPIVIYFQNNVSEKHYLLMKDSINSFTIKLKDKPISIVIDNEFETLRKINKWEKPTSFNQVLSSKPIVVIPDKTSEDFKVGMEFVKSLQESGYDFEYYTAKNLSKDDMENSNLILLGNSKNNSLINDFKSQLNDNLKLSDAAFTYDDKSNSLKENILMANVEHTFNSDKYCTIICFDGLKEVAPLNRLIHYQSYSLVLLNIARTGRPVYSTEIFPKTNDKTSLIWKLE